jgi:hypothetical protein
MLCRLACIAPLVAVAAALSSADIDLVLGATDLKGMATLLPAFTLSIMTNASMSSPFLRPGFR